MFITFQSAIKINHFQIWSFYGKIPRLYPYVLAKHRSFSSLFNLQSKSIDFKFGHFSANYQDYSLTFWPTIVHFHHFSICNQNESLSPFVIFRQKYHGYSLTFWPKIAHFHHFSICSHTQSISNLVIVRQNTKAIALLFGQKSLIFITFQSAIKINHCHLWSFFGKNTKVIALLFRQKSLIFITFQSAIKINHFQIWSFYGKIPRLYPYFLAKHRSISSLFNLQSKSITVTFGLFSANYQGHSLTFWPNIAHFHHFSICNQNQSLSNLVILRQNTKAIALLFGQTSLIFITFQSAIKINHFQIWSFYGKLPRLYPYFLAKHRSF